MVSGVLPHPSRAFNCSRGKLESAALGVATHPFARGASRNVDVTTRAASSSVQPTPDPEDYREELTAPTSPAVSATLPPEKLAGAEFDPIPAQSSAADVRDSRFQDVTKVFVAGASGRTGRAIVERLVSEGVRVKAFVRSAKKGVELLPGTDRGVELAEGDVSNYQGIPKAMAGCDVVICAIGAASPINPLDPFFVEYQGTLNLIAAAKNAGVGKFVLVTSLGVDELLSPLNLFGGVAFWKKQAELALQRSGLDYTIVRPGGLQEKLPSGEIPAPVVMTGPGTYGLFAPGTRLPTGSILRKQVADCCVEAVVEPEASNKVVEIVTDKNAPSRTYKEMFALVKP